MKEIKNLSQMLPLTSEDVVIAIGVLIAEASEDLLHAEETYVNLHRDAYKHNLHIELADFELEHPEMTIFEIDRCFRNIRNI